MAEKARERNNWESEREEGKTEKAKEKERENWEREATKVKRTVGWWEKSEERKENEENVDRKGLTDNAREEEER